jgi:phosphohistidine phosphatase
MRRLLLLRHAKTERAEPGERDRDRKLMESGRADAAVIGSYMLQHDLIPDVALVSPATRTQETWALVATALGRKPHIVIEPRIYNASSETLAEIIREDEDAAALMLVGHNPGLHDLALQLVGSGDALARDTLREKLPTSGLVVIDFAFDDWASLQEHAGSLERFVGPRLIDAASD